MSEFLSGRKVGKVLPGLMFLLIIPLDVGFKTFIVASNRRRSYDFDLENRKTIISTLLERFNNALVFAGQERPSRASKTTNDNKSFNLSKYRLVVHFGFLNGTKGYAHRS